jgi:hypothetical protein
MPNCGEAVKGEPLAFHNSPAADSGGRPACCRMAVILIMSGFCRLSILTGILWVG